MTIISSRTATTSHTPGPWFAEVGAGRVIGIGPEADVVDEVLVELHWTDPDFPTEKDWANARLIAASPDLLATLHPLMMAANAQVDWWKKEALRLRNIGAHDGSAQEIAARWFKLFKDADAAIAKATGGTLTSHDDSNK